MKLNFFILQSFVFINKNISMFEMIVGCRLNMQLYIFHPCTAKLMDC